MSAYNDALEEGLHSAFCDLAVRGIGSGLVFAAFTAETGAGLLAGLAASALSAHAYATYCGRPPEPPPYGTPQPWTGGQCDGVHYVVSISFALILAPMGSNVNVGRVGGNFDAVGPVRYARAYEDNPTSNDLRIQAGWKGGSADVSVVKGVNEDPENPQWAMQDVLIVVTRPDGLPDICGNPPPLPPPDRLDRPGDITYINNEGDTVNSPVHFDFRGARIGLNGDVNIPVNIRFDLDPTLNISGTININTGHFTPNNGPPGTPTGPGPGPGNVVTPPGTPPGTPPSVPPDPPTDPPDPDNDPPRKVIRGVVVTSTIAEVSATQIFGENIPDIFAPNLGYVSFLYKVDQTYAWSHDIPVKNAKQLIEVPWGYGAYDVKSTSRTGVTFSLIPIYDYVGFYSNTG